MSRLFTAITLTLAGMSIVALSGCPSEQPGGTTLSAADLAALGAATSAGYLMAESAGVAQAVASSDLAAATKTVDGTVMVAGCPVLTLSPADGAGVFNVSVSFGTGCPLPGQTTPVCIGTVSGQVDLNANRAILTLTGLSCTGAPTLDGNIDVVFTQLEGGAINLNGNWDLSFTTNNEQSRITGPGDVTFDPATQTATINQFQGQLTRGSDVWNITMTGVVIPLADNPSQLPSAGTVQLDGGFLRQFTIQFTDQSPSTGVVNVSIFGLFFFPVDVSNIGV